MIVCEQFEDIFFLTYLCTRYKARISRIVSVEASISMGEKIMD